MASWQALSEELALWQRQGHSASLWWRDDDAERRTPALERLSELSRKAMVPLALAVIPAGADRSLCGLFDANPHLLALQHGYSHRNHAPEGERKCELGGHRPPAQISDELQRGRERLTGLLGDHFFALLVPPWNRLDEALPDRLAALGFTGLSTLGPRKRCVIRELNVHVDLIDWRAGRQFAGDARVLEQLLKHLRARRLGQVDEREATGIMSHHLAQDEGCWDFLQRLLDYVAAQPALHWVDARSQF